MSPTIVLSQEVLAGEDPATVWAGHRLAQVAFLRHLHEVLVCLQRLLLDRILSLQIVDQRVLQLDLILNILRPIVGALVLHVQRLREALKVVLRIYQVLQAHLRESKEAHKVIREAIDVIAVDLGVGDILQKALVGLEVDLAGDLVQVDVADLPPVQALSALLELKLGRHRRGDAVEGRSEQLAGVLDAGEVHTAVDVIIGSSCGLLSDGTRFHIF